MSALKDCPFCGKVAMLTRVDLGGFVAVLAWVVRCMDEACPGAGGAKRVAQHEAIDVWNRRATTASREEGPEWKAVIPNEYADALRAEGRAQGLREALAAVEGDGRVRFPSQTPSARIRALQATPAPGAPQPPASGGEERTWEMERADVVAWLETKHPNGGALAFFIRSGDHIGASAPRQEKP